MEVTYFNTIKYPFVFTFAENKKEWKKILNDWGYKLKYPKKSLARVTIIYPNSAPVCILTVHKDVDEYGTADQLGIIAHEAVHVWQALEKYINEDSASDEMEAYSIQSITKDLLTQYLGKRVNGKN
jgi:hypothetical protein